MKKILATVFIISCIFCSCTKKVDIGELISKRNIYQAEYNLYHAEWELRQFEKYGYTDEYASFMATFEEFQREQICKDSIEILNIEIAKYQNK